MSATETQGLHPPSPAGALRLAGAALCGAVALFGYRYLFGDVLVPEVIASNRMRDPWLVAHVAAAATALLVAPVQFLPDLRARFGRLHRRLGRVYAVACIGGGAAGLMLALGASTGSVSTAGFGSLALLWMATTALAWRHALRRDFAAHRAWMIRSFAFTLAAVTLRVYLPLATLTPLTFEDAYRAISFLCWVPNLLVAELYLRRRP